MTSPHDALLSAEELTIGYPGLELFRDESFSVTRGSIFGIMGDSGSGKSTLLRCLIGLEQPLAGVVRFRGRDVAGLEPGRPGVGVSFQSNALFGSMTVRENLRLPLRTWTQLSERRADELIAAKLALVDVLDVIDRRPADISGGQARRVAIARSLILDPPLIFLDEPFAGLDPVSAGQLEELLERLNQGLGVTVVVVSHMLGRMIRICHRCLLISADERSVVAYGDPKELRQAPPNAVAAQFFGGQRETTCLA
ncbi:MAG: ATP-binding cassette domain-containing protein [Myxococcota bacterium]